MSSYPTVLGGKREMEQVLTVNTKLGRGNMQSWLRELQAILAVKFPKNTLNFLTTDRKWEPKPISREDYISETQGIVFTLADENKLKMAYVTEDNKYNKHVREVTMPAIAQIMRNNLSPEVESDLRGHSDYSEWSGEGEDATKCGDDPHALLMILNSVTRRNRYSTNAILQARDTKKLHHEQRNIFQHANETNALFKLRCEDVERECIKCGLTPLDNLAQTLVFVYGLTKGSRAYKHFESLLERAETSPDSFPTTLNKAWESLMILDTVSPAKSPSVPPVGIKGPPTIKPLASKPTYPTGSNNARKVNFAPAAERVQATINVTEVSDEYHEYPTFHVLSTTQIFGMEESNLTERYQRSSPSDTSMPSLVSSSDSDPGPEVDYEYPESEEMDEQLSIAAYDLELMQLLEAADGPNATRKKSKIGDDWETWEVYLGRANDDRTISPMTMEGTYNASDDWTNDHAIYATEVTEREMDFPQRFPSNERAVDPNFLIPTVPKRDLYVKKSDYRHVNSDYKVADIGGGLFTSTVIAVGAVILRAIGDIISREEADKLEYPRNKYLIRVDKDRVLDSHDYVTGISEPPDLLGMANSPIELYCFKRDRHLDEEDANAGVCIIDEELEEGVMIVMYALVQIEIDEEILWDYNMVQSESGSEDDREDILSPPAEGWLRTKSTQIREDSFTQDIDPDPPDLIRAGIYRHGAELEAPRDQSVCSSKISSSSAQAQGVFVNTLTNNSAYLFKISSPTENLSLDTLLDNQAGISLFKNTDVLSDIRKLRTPFAVKGIEKNGKGIVATTAGFFGPFGLVAISKEASSNVISVGEMVDRGFAVKYDPNSDSFTLRDSTTSTTLTFARKGRHYVLSSDDRHDDTAENVKKEVILTQTYRSTANNIPGTVRQRAEIYPKSAIRRAEIARQLQVRLGYPPSKDIPGMNIQGIDVTALDLSRADHIWGPCIPGMKGRQVKITSPAIIPGDLAVIEQNQTLQVDIMFIAKLPFMVGLLSPLGFCITQYIGGKKTPQIKESIAHILNVAKSRQIRVSHLITDNEGGVLSMSEDLMALGIQVSPTAAGEKAHKVERRIRYIKERVRSIMHGLPYNLNAMLLIHCVEHATWCTNLHIVSESTRRESPHEIFTGRRLDAKRDLRHSFGDYVQATVPHTNNTMAARTESHLTLGCTNSLTGGVRMYCISTGELRVRDQFHVFPIPSHIVKYLNRLAKADNMPSIDSEYVEPTVEQLSTLPPPISIADFDPMDVQTALTAEWRGDDTPSKPKRNNSTRQSSQIRTEAAILDDRINPSATDPDVTRNDITGYTPTTRGATPGTRGDTTGRRGGGIPNTNNLIEDIGPEQSHKASKTVIHIDRQIEDDSDEDSYDKTALSDREQSIADTMPEDAYWDGELEQYSVMNITVTRAIEELGDEARESISKELRQLWEKKAWTPVDVKRLKSDERTRIIRSSMFLKQKFDSKGNHDKLKSRLVAGGHMQDKTLYEDLSSPTAALMTVLLVCAIAAFEKRKTATVDIGGAYLNADMMTGIIVHMMLDKRMSDMLVQIDESYKRYLTHKGELCVRLDKALYGCVESALLWHNHLTATLKEIGFLQNPIDPCLYNLIDKGGLQCTAVAHVDDLLVTCENEETIQMVLDHLEHKYKTISESRGSAHSYLGMTVDFGIEGECSVGMTGYEGFMVEGYGYSKKHPTPALEDLFDVDETSENLDESEMKHFHTYVAKLLYLAKRTRPECLVATSFLCTRVTRSTKQDLAKLNRVMGYLKGTPNRTMILRPGNGGIMPRLYVDASYGVHADGKSHTGSSIIIGDTGAVFNKSCKQSIVTKSSTEAELVAASDALNQLLHARELIKHQNGRPGNDKTNEVVLAPSPFYQDNKSTIAMIKVGRATHEKSRHINIRHFWIHGKVKDKSVTVEYMPTELMIANVLTKPLQGEQFRKETAMITGNEEPGEINVKGAEGIDA